MRPISMRPVCIFLNIIVTRLLLISKYFRFSIFSTFLEFAVFFFFSLFCFLFLVFWCIFPSTEAFRHWSGICQTIWNPGDFNLSEFWWYSSCVPDSFIVLINVGGPVAVAVSFVVVFAVVAVIYDVVFPSRRTLHKNKIYVYTADVLVNGFVCISCVCVLVCVCYANTAYSMTWIYTKIFTKFIF